MNLKDILTIIVLTENEQIHIGRCLKSISSLKVNTYLIDSFSSDETIKIAEKFGVTILQNKYINPKGQVNYFLSRNLTNTSNWVLRLDADEYLTTNSIKKLKKLLANINDDVGLIHLRLQRVFQGKHLKYGTLSGRFIPRLWRPDGASHSIKEMDEKLVANKGYKEYKSDIDFYDASLITPSNFVIKHIAYVERQLEDMEKGLEKNSSILKKIYYSLPFEVSSLILFLYRYILRLGFLDGRRGLWYHFLQCLFYRNMIGLEEYSRKKNKVNY